MSYRVVGYDQGRRIVVDEGPAAAHRTAHTAWRSLGGNGMSAFVVPPLAPMLMTSAMRERERLRNKRRREQGA